MYTCGADLGERRVLRCEQSAVLSLVSIMSASIMNIRNVSLQSTGLSRLLERLHQLSQQQTLLTSIINISPQRRIEQQHAHTFDVLVTNSNSLVVSTHTTDLPPAAFVILVTSVITAINIVRTVANSTLLLSNVAVRRQPPSTTEARPSSWFAETSTCIHYNFTTMVNLLDATTTLMSSFLTQGSTF